MNKNNNVIYGTQYYRYPTPDKSQWEEDLKNIHDMGMMDVKFWVQWRVNNFGPNKYDFSDIDTLMDLAYKNDLRVTLNVIFDVAPVWFLKKYPCSVQVTADGRKVEQSAPGHRQIGGFPGTCYNHIEARECRKMFLIETVKRYKDHPALYMWDIWNEPEQCGIHRYVNGSTEKVTCYCDSCKMAFIMWLRKKYKTIDELNRVWGKCFPTYEDIELPNNVWTLKDFMDFKLFHSEVMTNEANMRIETVKSVDKGHPVYLHVVPNTSTIFNAVSGVDDFALARKCDVFASTNFSSPIWSILTLSAGRGKRCYNAECHIGSGSIKMHQKTVTYNDLVKDFVPQIGAGIRGFMFWQYRPEVLGHEGPAWGMTELDGSIGSVGHAAKEFGEKLKTIEKELNDVFIPECSIAIWKGFENELFQYASQMTLEPFGESIANYVNAIYWNNYNVRIVDDSFIINEDLDGIKLLIMPECYCVSKRLFNAVDNFVKKGGVLLCEAHFGGFDTDNGRHSFNMPGCGAKEKWGISEIERTSSYWLDFGQELSNVNINGVSDDVKKAIEAYGASGRKYYPALFDDNSIIAMCERVAFLGGYNIQVIATMNNKPIILLKNYGKGKIYYCGSNIGEGAEFDKNAFSRFICSVIKDSRIKANFEIEKNVHIDVISEELIAVNNTLSDEDIVIDADFESVFFDKKSTDQKKSVVHAHCADILKIKK